MLSASVDNYRRRDWTISMARSFALSLIIHFLIFAGIELGHHLGYWDKKEIWRALTSNEIQAALERQRLQNQRDAAAMEIPLVFVEVDPDRAVAEAPQDAKYYSSVSSKAANPEPQMLSDTPKIDGTQDKVARVEDVARPMPLQPSILDPPRMEIPPKEASPAEQPVPEERPAAGDLAFAPPGRAEKIQEKPKPPPPEEPVKPPPARRPRIAEAKARLGLAGEKMKQEGGAARRGQISLDVRGTPFGAYDKAIIEAIQQRWWDLIEAQGSLATQSGKVVLEFRLRSDGRVTDMNISESEVGDILALLCRKAVEDPAPFAPWPSDMRRMFRENYRDVRFTFYYN